MPILDQFVFVNTDPVVQRYLDATERGQVTRWQQQGGAYQFEFHTGHTNGNPLYVRPTGETTGSNLPKMLTAPPHTAAEYNACTKFANGGKLCAKNATAPLSAAAQADLLAVVATSWNALALLTDRYWRGAPVLVPPAPAPVVAAAAATKPCGTVGCGGVVPVVASGKAACNACWRYQ